MRPYVGINRDRCGFGPNSRVLRTLEDGYRLAGYDIFEDTVGFRHRLTMENVTDTSATISTGEPVGVYSRQSHIPFPNTPVVRGIGGKMAIYATGWIFGLLQRAVVLGGAMPYYVCKASFERLRSTGSSAHRPVSVPPFHMGFLSTFY